MINELLKDLSFNSNKVDMKKDNADNSVSPIGSRIKNIKDLDSINNLSSLDTGINQSDMLEVNKLEYDKIASKISKKLDSKLVSKLSREANDIITKGDFELDPDTIKILRQDMINKISTSLSKPGMPLNQKTTLMRLIKKYCNNKNSINFNQGLRNLLSMLSMSALMKLIACLSNPIALSNLLKGMLTEEITDQTDDAKLSKVIVNTLDTKKVNAKTLVELAKTNKGKELISTGLIEADIMYHSIKNDKHVSRSLREVSPDGIDKLGLNNLIETTNTNDKLVKSKKLPEGLRKLNNVYLKSKNKTTDDIPDITVHNLIKIKEAFG